MRIFFFTLSRFSGAVVRATAQLGKLFVLQDLFFLAGVSVNSVNNYCHILISVSDREAEKNKYNAAERNSPPYEIISLSLEFSSDAQTATT